MSDVYAALARACEGEGGGSSDFDLNPEFRPEGLKTREAGVLIPVCDAPDGVRLILTKRSSALKHHPGQIAFPGGKVDPGDADAVTAALREAEEEIGLDHTNVDVLGVLPFHETVTAFRMTPVIGRVKEPFDFRAEPGEVEEVFTVPLTHVTNPANYIVEGRYFRGSYRRYFTVPYGPYYIWGATARVLRVLADRLAG